ncbi:MAG: hypothetical protein ABSH56_13240 [Bryobacteraceae bacterium]
MHGSLHIIAAKEEEHAEVAPRVRIIWIERDDGAELTGSQVGPVVLQELRCLPKVSFDLLLPAGRGLCERKSSKQEKYAKISNCFDVHSQITAPAFITRLLTPPRRIGRPVRLNTSPPVKLRSPSLELPPPRPELPNL